nr:immunoglobulin heavy chain junction region [Mus musculus]MBK4184145.1 immunoglobulin heavy chain junction region [Mus musculus]
CARYSGFAYW